MLYSIPTYARLKLYYTTSFTVKVKHGEETTFLLLRGRTKLCWLINFYVCSHVTGSVYLFVIVFNLYLGLFCDRLSISMYTLSSSTHINKIEVAVCNGKIKINALIFIGH